MVDSVMKRNLFIVFIISIFAISGSTGKLQNAVTKDKTLPEELNILHIKNALRQIITGAKLKVRDLSRFIEKQSLNNTKIPFETETRCLAISEEIDKTKLEDSYKDKKQINRLETRSEELSLICNTVRRDVSDLCYIFQRFLRCMRATLGKNMQDGKRNLNPEVLKNTSLKLVEISRGIMEKVNVTYLAQTFKQLAQGKVKISSTAETERKENEKPKKTRNVNRMDPNTDGPLILSIAMVVEGSVIVLVFVIMLFVIISSRYSGEAYLVGYSSSDLDDDGELPLQLFEYRRFASPDQIDLERSRSPAPVHFPKRY